MNLLNPSFTFINGPEYRKNTPDYFIFLLFFFYSAGITSFNSTDIGLVIMAGIGFLYMHFSRREKIDNIFWYVLLYWILINFLSWVFVGAENFSFYKLGGSVFKLFIGYVFMKIYKEKFIVWFEQTVFFLALVSLLFFAVQLMNPDIFSKIPFNLVDEQRGEAGHWYGIIFHYSSWHPTQNSGVTGEPGGFGYYIGLAMIFNLIIHRGAINRRFILFVLVGLTTFSTNFYLSLILFGIFFIYRSTLFAKLISITLFIPLLLLLYSLPFVGEKLTQYLDETKQFSESTIVKRTRLNRTSMFVNDLRDLSKYPLGRGINETGLKKNIYGEVFEGTNDFSRIAVIYGILGLIFFLIIYYKMFRKISLNLKGSLFFVFIMCMYIAANSLERDYFALSLFWLYYLTKEERLKQISGEHFLTDEKNKLAIA